MMATAAFDRVADRYDADFTHTRLGQLLRQRVWRQLEYAFAAGDHVLELGCGTGEDALWLAQRHVSVLATDVSEGMLNVARRKAADQPLLRFERQDVNALTLTGQFDGAFANFGVLNCVHDRVEFAARLADALRPGGLFVAVVMPPFCLWETAWYALRGDVQRATRRWKQQQLASVGGAQLPVWYPSARRVQAELAEWFGRRHLEGLGTVLPPSYLARFVEGWPAWTATLDNALPYGQLWADHYILVLERR
jgi:SAM-dependent methyltransferase